MIMSETPIAPAQRQHLDDTDVIARAVEFSYGERALALAVSDMPTARAERMAALGNPESVPGRGPVPNRSAALVASRWILQGVERLGGGTEVWRLDYDWRRGDLDPVELHRLVGGAHRYNAGLGLSHAFPFYLGEDAPKPRLVTLYVVSDHEDQVVYGQQHLLRDLQHMAALNDGLELRPYLDGYRFVLTTVEIG